MGLRTDMHLHIAFVAYIARHAYAKLSFRQHGQEFTHLERNVGKTPKHGAAFFYIRRQIGRRGRGGGVSD